VSPVRLRSVESIQNQRESLGQDGPEDVRLIIDLLLDIRALLAAKQDVEYVKGGYATE
jgi:hypothetical protein